MLPEIHVHTAKGVLFNVTHPVQEEIDIENIAYQLAMQCRFNGAVRDFRFYSVAEHSYWGSFITPTAAAYPFLLHDAQEAYISDVIRPIKRHDVFFNELEERVELAVHKKFGIDRYTQDVWDNVKAADNYMGYMEAQELLVFGYSDAGRPVPPYTPRLHLDPKQFGHMNPRTAFRGFMERYEQLKEEALVA
jgi:hypothetical protein